MHDIVRALVDAVDPETQATAIAVEADRAPADVVQDLLDTAVEPLAANPELRTRIIELRRAKDQVIDEVSRDEVLEAHGVVDPDKAKHTIESWREYLSEHRSEISAIELMFEAKGRGIRFDQIQELADRIARPPHNWTVDIIWNSYLSIGIEYQGHTETRNRHAATDLISLLRLEAGVDDALVPYSDRVEDRYANWLHRPEQAGATFTETQRWWLDRMMRIIASSAGIDADDLDNAPFDERDGIDGVAAFSGRFTGSSSEMSVVRGRIEV